MGGKSKKATVGYQYHLGIHMVLCHGPVDKVIEISVDDRVAWEGTNDGTTPIEFDEDAAELFGGKKREGGVGGIVDIEMGGPAQGQNAYLVSQLGEDVPSFRGVTSAVLNQCYVGNNPYLKAWAFRVQRIHTRQDGIEQWYDEKAEIGTESGEGGYGGHLALLGFDSFVSTISTEGELVWPFSTGSETNLYRAYTDFIATGNLATSFSGTGDAPGYRRGPISSWSWDGSALIPLACGRGVVECANINDGSPSIVLGMKHPSGAEMWGDHAFTAVITGLDGSGLIDGEIVRNSGKRWTLTTTTQTITGVEVPVYVGIYSTPDGGGGYTHELKININGDQVALPLGAIGDAWSRVDVFISSDTPYQYNYDGNYNFRVEASVTARVTTGSTVRTLSHSGYKQYSSTGSMVGVSAGGHTLYTSPTYFYLSQLSTASIATGVFDYDEVPVDELADDLALAYALGCQESGVCGDMNPAHIVRECLTDPVWGMGYQDADIDDASFMAAADQLYSEVMGISLLWDRQIPLEDFIAEILRHVDGVLYVDRISGKFVLKLVRDDYSVPGLVTLDESNVLSVSNASRPTIGELTNSVTVNYHDKETGETGSVGVQDQALIQIQQATIGTTVQYPGFTYRNLATRVAQRDLKALSIPLLSADLVATREAASLNIGDPFLLDWPDLDISDVVMRVQSIGFGDGRDNGISITAVEDVFSLSGYDDTEVGDPESGLWVDPTTIAPQIASPRIVTEMPYYPLVLDRGQLAVDSVLDDEPDAGFLLAAGGRQGGELNASLMVDSGGGYNDSDTLDFAPYATLSMDAWYTDTELYIVDGVDLDLVESGGIAQIEDELVRVDGFGSDSNGDYVSVGRGVLDTVPARHVANSNGFPDIVFISDFIASDEVQYTASDELDVKMLTTLGSSSLSLAGAPLDSVIMASRAVRPYPPGDLRVDNISYPEAAVFSSGVTLSWKHRDRGQQTGGSVLDYSDGHVGPEPGTTYAVKGRSLLDTGEFSADWYYQVADPDSSGYAESVDLALDSSSGSPPPGTEYIYFRVVATRDGYEAWQSPEVGMVYTGDIDTPWTPAEITTALWLDADDADTLWQDTAGTIPASDGDGVARWDSKSGDGNFAYNGTAAYVPTLQGATLDGKPVVRLDGSNDYLALDSVLSVSAGIAAFAVIISRDASGRDGGIFKASNYTSLNQHFAGASGTTDWYDTFFSTSRVQVSSANYTTDTPYLVSIEQTGSAVVGRVNGASAGSASATFAGSPSSLLIGTTTPGYYSRKDYAEVVFIQSPSEADRDRVEGYLAWKWGLEGSLDAGHPYKDDPPYL